MFTWNHRVVKKTLAGNDFYAVHEVHYNDNGSIFAYTEEPVDISGESIEDLREYCQWILDCFDKEVLVDGEVKFAEISPQKGTQ